MPSNSSLPAFPDDEVIEDDFGNVVSRFRADGDHFEPTFPSDPYSAPDPLHGTDYSEPIRLGPAEELPPESVSGTGDLGMRFRLERVLQERDSAVAALENERSQRDQRVAALNDEQERFVARMLREHEEEMFVSSRDARRTKDELRRTQQDLGKARRDVGRLRGELEGVHAELNAARDELERLRLVQSRGPEAADFALQSHSRLRADGASDAELERLLVQYSREMESRPGPSTSRAPVEPVPVPQRLRATKVVAKEERPRILKKSRGR